MGRACTICAHPNRPSIDTAVRSAVPIRRAAKDFGVGETALRRHRDAHLDGRPSTSPPAAASIRAREAADRDTELREARQAAAHAIELLAEVRGSRDALTAALARAEARLDAAHARLVAADTAQAELRRLVAQAASKPLALEVTGRTVEHPLEEGADRPRFAWLPWRRSSTMEAR